MFRLKVNKGANAQRSEVRISINPFHAEVLLNMHACIHIMTVVNLCVFSW